MEVAGAEVAAPRDFRPRPLTLVRRVPATEGSTDLSLRLASMPGASLDVTVRFAPAEPSPMEVAAAEDLASLDRMVCDELNRNIEAILDPVVAEAFIESVQTAGAPFGRVGIHRSPHGLPSYLGPLPSEGFGGATDPEVVALAWLERHAALMGQGPRSSFTPERVTPLGSGTDVVGVAQSIAGLPVFGGYAKVLVQAGQIRRVLAAVAPDPALPTVPQVTAEQAEAIARRAHPEAAHDTEPVTTLGFWNGAFGARRSEVALAWQVELGNTETAFVDALSGTVLDLVTTRADLSAQIIEIPEDPDPDRPTLEVDRLTIEDDIVTEDNDCLDSPGGDTRCLRLAGGIEAADRFYTRVWERPGGWGNGAPYVVRFGDGLEDVNANAELRFSMGVGAGHVNIGNAVISNDTVAHEFGGHGFLRDPDIRGGGTMAQPDFLEEHAGDTIAMLTALSTGAAEPFAMNTALPDMTIRDHSVLTCEGYTAAVCDAPNWDPLRVELGAGASQRQGCREYTHLDFLNNLGAVAETVHEDSCPYSRLPYLLLDGPRTNHGIVVAGGLSRELVAKLYRMVFRNDGTPAGRHKYWVYQEDLRNAMLEMVSRCSSTSGGVSLLPGIPECDAIAAATSPGDRLPLVLGLVEDLFDAYYSLGFWSAPMPLDFPTSIPPTVVEASAAGPDPAGLYVFYVDAAGSGELGYDVLRGPTRPDSAASVVLRDRLAAPEAMQTSEQVAAVADGPDLHVAFVDAATGLVRLARRDASGAWTVETPTASEPSAAGVALALIGGRELVVFTAPDRSSLGYFFADEPVAPVRIRGEPERFIGTPSLARIVDGAEERWLLAYAVKNDLESNARLLGRVLDIGSGRFGDAFELPRLPAARFALEQDCPDVVGCTSDAECCDGHRCNTSGSCEAKACSSDSDCDGDSRCVAGRCSVYERDQLVAAPNYVELPRSISAVPFPGADGRTRLQVLVVANGLGIESEQRLSVTTIPVRFDGEVVLDDYRTSRQVQLSPRASGGLSATVFRGTGSPRVVAMYRRGTRVEMMWRRSE